MGVSAKAVVVLLEVVMARSVTGLPSVLSAERIEVITKGVCPTVLGAIGKDKFSPACKVIGTSP